MRSHTTDPIDVILIMMLCFVCWIIGIVTTLAIQSTIKENLEQQIIADRPSLTVYP